jgi:hypothetical protein
VTEDQLISKIRAEMERGITSECQVVYLLVEIRKLMDRDTTKAAPYNSLRLYSDWAVHIHLYGPQAQEIVKRADAHYPKLMNGTATEQEKADFEKLFSLKAFREEIDRFLQDHVGRSFSDEHWNKFMYAYLHVVEDCPLICKPDNATLANIDEVFVIRDGDAQQADVTQPGIVWGLRFKGELKMPIGTDIVLSNTMIDTIVALSETRPTKTTSVKAPSANP